LLPCVFSLRARSRVAVLVALALAVCAAGRAAADEAARTNLDLMTDLSRAVAGELYGGFGKELGGRGVRLQPFASNEEYQFITNIFTRVLTEQGVTVYPPGREGRGAGDAGAGDEVVLEYQLLTFSLSYPKVYRAHLIGGKRVKRRADVHILASLSGERGAVGWVGEASREESDQFAHDALGRIEEGAYQFTRPGVPSSGWGKYVEPVVVTGIIVGLVYLFFSNQSDS